LAVTVCDVGPRDGLQNEAETLEPAADLASLRERTRELLAGRPLYSGLPHGYPSI
jgi:hypothetical protein